MLVSMETCFKGCLSPSLYLESFCCHNSHIRLLPSPHRLPHYRMQQGFAFVIPESRVVTAKGDAYTAGG